jgi:hypothetical protein
MHFRIDCVWRLMIGEIVMHDWYLMIFRVLFVALYVVYLPVCHNFNF